MGVFNDALAALKNVVLIQERVDGVKSDNARMADDLRALTEKVFDLDKRVYALERIIDLGARQSRQKRIEE